MQMPRVKVAWCLIFNKIKIHGWAQGTEGLGSWDFKFSNAGPCQGRQIFRDTFIKQGAPLGLE